jgi:lipocalin
VTALAGEPGRDHLWILAREISISSTTLARLVARADALGFHTGELFVSRH